MMRMMLANSLLTLSMAVFLPAAVQADRWTGSEAAAQAAREFADAARRLQKAIHDASEESPLAVKMQRLSMSAGQLHDAVQKGVTYEDALEDFREIEGDYVHFEGELKKGPRRPPRRAGRGGSEEDQSRVRSPPDPDVEPAECRGRADDPASVMAARSIRTTARTSGSVNPSLAL
jgi:hypothetical protein